MSICRVISCVAGNGWGVCCDRCVLLTKLLLTFALLHFVLQDQTCLFLQVSLDFLLLHSNLLWLKGRLVLLLDLEGLAGLQGQKLQVNFSFFSISGWGIGLDYCDVEWFMLETNWDCSVIFETATKYCILDSSVDYENYSISSKEFLPIAVNIMII